MKHIEVDYHVVRRKYDADIIELKHVFSANQPADLLTKPLRDLRFHLQQAEHVQCICSKLKGSVM